MRKGLTTLTAVAVALLGFNAMAMAPVVQELASPVVGDATGNTFDNYFVFPDAWNLDNLVTDAETPDADIRWSYVVGAHPGTFGAFLSKYSLNGVDPLVDPSAGEAISPPTANRIDVANASGEDDEDSNPRTVTIRDRDLSPIGGPNVDPDQPGQIVGSEVITLFASDGSTVTLATVVIYTQDNSDDYFSGITVEVVETLDGSTWTTSDFVFTDFGGSTYSQNGTTGACITVGAAGDNYGQLDSPDGRFELSDLSVYRARAEMSTTAATGATPLISMTYNSQNNEWGGEIIILDNVGSANMPTNGTTGRSEFQFWLGPAGAEAAAWRDGTTGAFASTPEGQAARNFKLVLRLLDIASVVNGSARSGSVCWKTIELGRISLPDLITGEANIFTGNLVAADGSTGFELVNIPGIDQWTVGFAGGVATITADQSPTVGVALATFRPGNGDGNAVSNPAGLADDNPVAWDTPDQLLHVAYSIAAADAASAADPPEVMRVGMDMPSQEILTNHFISVLGIGEKLMPTTTATTYHCFHYTHSVTAAVFANAQTQRPVLDFADRNAGGEFGTDATTVSTGSWDIDSVTVGDVSANNQ